jgi:hypothetical protein
VRNLRDTGHHIVRAADFAVDPGSTSLLAQSVSENRVFLTKDHDIGALVYRDLRRHCGVLLVGDERVGTAPDVRRRPGEETASCNFFMSVVTVGPARPT